MGFNCSQHQCCDCDQKTADAGGLIFRCRWCARGYCEDCLDFEKTELIGDNLKEYELLQYPSVTQAYYICCPTCTDDHAANPSDKEFCASQAAEIDTKYQIMLDEQERDEESEAKEVQKSSIPTPSDTVSLTDASTIDDSAVATPYLYTDDGGHSSRKKRKAAPASFKLDMIPLDGSEPPESPREPIEIRSSPSTRAKRKVSSESKSPDAKKTKSSKRSKYPRIFE